MEWNLAEGKGRSASRCAANNSKPDDLPEGRKADDKDQIIAKTSALTEASAKIAEKLYATADAGTTDTGTDAGSSEPEDDVVDAEFEEVKDDEKK